MWGHLLRRRPADAALHEQRLPSRYELVELWTEEHRIRGWIDTDRGGLTEQLIDGPEFHLGGLVVSRLDAWPLSRPREPVEASAWRTVSIEAVQFAIPEEPLRDPERRWQRRQIAVHLTVGGFVIGGTAHLSPGAVFDPLVIAIRQPFLPLTDASVRHVLLHAIDEQAPTVIVNLAAVSGWRRL